MDEKKMKDQDTVVTNLTLESEERVVPKESSWQTFMEGLYGFTSDVFEDGRDQGIQEDRESL